MQLLYRASVFQVSDSLFVYVYKLVTLIVSMCEYIYIIICFQITQRDGESSLMQLHTSFRTYEELRRAHDAEIMQVAMETGLRISPEQWSSLLYGDIAHKSQMQSNIDKVS